MDSIRVISRSFSEKIDLESMLKHQIRLPSDEGDDQEEEETKGTVDALEDETITTKQNDIPFEELNSEEERQFSLLNKQLDAELNRKLEDIRQIDRQIDDELRKRESQVERRWSTSGPLNVSSSFASIGNQRCHSNDLLGLFTTLECNAMSPVEEEQPLPDSDDQLLNSFDSPLQAQPSLFTIDAVSAPAPVITHVARGDLPAPPAQISSQFSLMNRIEQSSPSPPPLPARNHPITFRNAFAVNTQQPLKEEKEEQEQQQLTDSVTPTPENFIELSTPSTASEVKFNISNALISSDLDLSSRSRASLSVSICSDSGLGDSIATVSPLNNDLSGPLSKSIVRKGTLFVQQQQHPTSFLTKNKDTEQQYGSSISLASASGLKQAGRRLLRQLSLGPSVAQPKWKQRFFLLTASYLWCFKKGRKRELISADMGKFLFKVGLGEHLQNVDRSDAGGRNGCIRLTTENCTWLLHHKDVEMLREWHDSISNTRKICLEEERQRHRQQQQQQLQNRRSSVMLLFTPELNHRPSSEDKKRPLSGAQSSNDLSRNFDEADHSATLQRLVQLQTSLGDCATLTRDASRKTNKTELDSNAKQANLIASACHISLQPMENASQSSTPIISNRKRTSVVQRKSILSQFDSLLGVKHNRDQNGSESNNVCNSPAPSLRLAPQCQAAGSNGSSPALSQPNSNSQPLPYTPFTLSNSPALAQRSLYAQRILSGSSCTLSGLARFAAASRSSGNSLLRPFQALHYATSSRLGGTGTDSRIDRRSSGSSHLKTATSEFSFIRLSSSPSTMSTLDAAAAAAGIGQERRRPLSTVISGGGACGDMEDDLSSNEDSDEENDFVTEGDIAFGKKFDNNRLRCSQTSSNLKLPCSGDAGRTIILSASSFQLPEPINKKDDKSNVASSSKPKEIVTKPIDVKPKNKMNDQGMNLHSHKNVNRIGLSSRVSNRNKNNSLEDSDTTTGSYCSSSGSTSGSNSRRHSVEPLPITSTQLAKAITVDKVDGNPPTPPPHRASFGNKSASTGVQNCEKASVSNVANRHLSSATVTKGKLRNRNPNSMKSNQTSFQNFSQKARPNSGVVASNSNNNGGERTRNRMNKIMESSNQIYGHKI